MTTKIDMRDAFFDELVKVARADERIVVLSADHGAFALKKFEEEMPHRYINVGIAEQNMVGVAAGMAASSKIVFIYGIAPFVSLRVLEQLTIDVAAMQLPVNVISVGAGFTYSTDGPTHQGLQDVSAISSIPGLSILNSSDPINTKKFVNLAVNRLTPHYIRIEKEKTSNLSRIGNIDSDVLYGFSVIRRGEGKVVVISTGFITHEVIEAVDRLEAETDIRVTLIDLFALNPFPSVGLLEILKNANFIISISEMYKNFFSQRLGELFSLFQISGKLINLGIDDEFIFIGDNRNQLIKKYNLNCESILNFLKTIEM